jgi:hypothetical protein
MFLKRYSQWDIYKMLLKRYSHRDKCKMLLKRYSHRDKCKILLKRYSHRDKCKVSERSYLYDEVSVKAKSKVSKTNEAKGSDASMSPINKFAYNFFSIKM